MRKVKQKSKRRHDEIVSSAESINPCRNSLWLKLIIITLMAVIPYIPSIDGDFVFDDTVTVVKNPVVNGKVSIGQILFTDYWGQPIHSSQSHKSYRPLTTLTFWSNYQLHNLWTTPYHIVNIILHMISTTLLFFLISEIRGLPSGYSTSHFIWDEATVAAATFAIHPVHTEAVANISGRAELLMSVFALTSILYYNYCLRKRVLNVYNMIIIFIIVLASIFSKEQGVTVLPIFLLLEIFNFNLLQRNRLALIRSMIVVLFTVVVVLLRLNINGFIVPKFTELDNAAAFVPDRWLRLASYCYQWLVNIRLLLLPYSLCFDYSMGCVPTVKSWSDYEALSLPLLLLIVLFIIVLLVKIHDKLLHFGIFFGILTFLPASNLLVTVGFTVAERVLYLPSIGVCVCGAVLFDNVQRRFKNTEKILLALFVIAMTKSYQRSEEWRTELDLYSSGLRVCINNAKIHYNLGKVLAKIGDVEGAEYNYWNAIRLNPHYEHAMNNLANILEVKGRYRDAELLLRKAIRSKPTFAAAWMNLGITLMNQNKFEDALESFNESLRLRPSNADCFFNIGNLYQKIGQSKNAIVSWENAIRLNPTHSRALINLFVMLDELEKCELVVEMSRNLPDKLASNEAALTFQIGICLGKMKKFQEAELRLKTAIRLNPQNPLYYTNLGILYHQWSRYELAERMYVQALTIDPVPSDSTRMYLQTVQQKLNRSRTTVKKH